MNIELLVFGLIIGIVFLCGICTLVYCIAYGGVIDFTLHE